MGNKRQIADLQAIFGAFIDQKRDFIGCNLVVIDQSACFTGEKH
jgi:hypothetical protein